MQGFVIQVLIKNKMKHISIGARKMHVDALAQIVGQLFIILSY